MSGAFFETFVVTEVIKSYMNADKRAPVYYYRDSDGKEIDLIIEENGHLYPIEIKKTSQPKVNTARHFPVLRKAGLLCGSGSVICMADDLSPISEDIWAVPVWLI